jgi:hypothetical protein
VYALQQKVRLLVDELSAYESTDKIEPIDQNHTLYIYVEDFRKCLPGERLPTAARKLWHTLLGSSKEGAEDARDHAGEFADWLVANYLTEKRLIINLTSGTVVLDGEAYSGIPPEVLAILKFLQDHPGQKFSTEELQTKIPGIKGQYRVRDLLDQIEEPIIRQCIKGKPGSGRWLELPIRPI